MTLSADNDTMLLRAQDPHALYEGADNAVPFYKKELPSPLSFAEPQTMAELEQRLHLIMGRSIGELTQLSKLNVAAYATAKGFAGQLVELFLGAHAHNQSGPDFTKLGIELKTVPVGFDLMPQEHTFICAADLAPRHMIPFAQSALFHKMQHMLFVMLLAPRNAGLSMGERRILGYFFFDLTGEHRQQVETDYNEMQELLLSHQFDQLTSSLGNVLQLRPRGLPGKDVVAVHDEEGQLIYTKTRGYYLRSSFTRTLLQSFIAEQGVDSEALNQLQNFKKRLHLQEDDDDSATNSDGE